LVVIMKIIAESIFESAEGYVRARIPGIMCDNDGIIFAYCELRRDDSDWAVIDIGMKKSADGGKTWSDRQILVSGGKSDTVNNPLMITDGDILHFLYCVNYHRVFYKKSTDKGETWTEKRDITDSIREGTGDFFFSCIATGPCHGVRLSSGRLLVPVWLAYNKEDAKSHHPSVICLLYSDDRGESWHTGKINSLLADPSEFCVAESSDGTVIANIRHEEAEKCRVVARVTDECEITQLRFAENLPDPVCAAGLCSVGHELLFTNCANKNSRSRLELKRLTAESVTKEEILINEKGGYSDIAVSPDKKTAFILHENDKSIIFTSADVSF